MIKLKQFMALIEMLSCPFCCKLSSLLCINWHKASSGFFMTIKCWRGSCKFSIKFSSTTSPKESNCHNAPSMFVIAWGLLGLGFKWLKSIWTMAGGILPVSKGAYARMMKTMVRPWVMVLAEASCACQLQKLHGHGCGDILMDTCYSLWHWHANKATTVARNAHAGNCEGGIVGHHHILKDTASGAPQHVYCTYMGMAMTAEGDALAALLQHLQESGLTVMSVTADGDTSLRAIVQEVFGEDVPVHCNPNHYVKGLQKNVKSLAKRYPALAPLKKSLKAHFLLGVKLFTKDGESFCQHMQSYVPHITNQSHSYCHHAPHPPMPTPLLNPVEAAEAIKQLESLIKSYLNN